MGPCLGSYNFIADKVSKHTRNWVRNKRIYGGKVQLFSEDQNNLRHLSIWFWHLLSKRQNHEEDSADFCGLLRKAYCLKKFIGFGTIYQLMCRKCYATYFNFFKKEMFFIFTSLWKNIHVMGKHNIYLIICIRLTLAAARRDGINFEGAFFSFWAIFAPSMHEYLYFPIKNTCVNSELNTGA